MAGSLLAASLAACSSGIISKTFSAFDSRYPDNDSAQVAAVAAKIVTFAGNEASYFGNSMGRPLMVAVKLGQPQMVAAYTLDDGKVLWEKPYQPSSKPAIVDGLVIFKSGTDIVALDIKSGAQAWSYPTKSQDFYGVSGDSGRVYITFGLGGETAVGSGRRGILTAVSANSGLKLWEHEMENVRMGESAVAGDLVFVPWDRQNVSVLDAGSGDEICRIRTKDDVVNFILTSPEGIYYGSRGLYRFDARSWSGTKEGSTHYQVPVMDVPGKPELSTDKLVPVSGLTTARDKIRFFWAPASSQDPARISLANSMIYLLYYRFLFAFDQDTGELRWVHRSKLDVEDVKVVPGVVYIVDKKGDVVLLETSGGQVVHSIATGSNLITAVLDTGRFVPPFTSPAVAQGPLRQDLINLVLDNDNRLVPIRKYTLGFLAAIPDPEVTKDLLDVYITKGIPQEMKDVARDMLLGRESGAAYLVDSMKYHFNYLDETIPPPMGVVAQTLVKMSAKEGVPGLLQHLLDHETPPADLREIALAIKQLGDASVVPTLKDFLVLYHADSAFADQLDTLVILVGAIHDLGTPADRDFLLAMVGDPLTLPALAQQIDGVFKDAAQKIVDAKLAAEKAAADKAAADKAALEGPVEPVTPKGPLPNTLTQKQISDILNGYAMDFAPCIQDYVAKNPQTSQIRMKFIITSGGKAEKLMTLPSDPVLSSCLLTKIVKVEFPPIKSLKQNAQYVIAIKKPKTEEEAEWPPVPTPGEEIKPPTVPSEKPPDELPPDEGQPPPPTWQPQPPPPNPPPGEEPPLPPPDGGQDYPEDLPEYPDELPE